MSKWQYKVVSVKGVGQDPSNHSVDVSIEGGKTKNENMRSGLEKMLNKLGSDGWELVCSLGEFVLLKKGKR